MWPIASSLSKASNVICVSSFLNNTFTGASLAQDRGRLEAKIEVLSSELETQKKLNERDSDTLKIKAKIVDDQTETIRKLKEVKMWHQNGSAFFFPLLSVFLAAPPSLDFMHNVK